MRLCVSKTKNATSYYVTKSIYENGRRSTRVVEKLGTAEELEKKLNGQDIVEWAKSYIAGLNAKEKAMTREIAVRFSPVRITAKGEKRSFNGGYLFLKKIYHELGISGICESISKNRKFTYDLDSIVSRLVYGRIIYPTSKLATMRLSERFIEQPDFKLHHIYRALEVVAEETDFLQAQLYRNSLKVSKRNTGVLYYDCTNYFFETEQEEGMKQYGYSKEHKPSPIVQMGLFMDGDGVPLAFDMSDGNTNGQVTLKPLEERILSDFSLSRFVVCTDAGLSSTDNRKFNDRGGRAFITTQSIKKLKKHLKTWAMDPKGWRLPKSRRDYDISKLDDKEALDKFTGDEDEVKEKTFYKERWINEDGIEQRLLVTYSVKYRDYQRKIRGGQIERAKKLIDRNPKKWKKASQNDFKRFIQSTSYTADGETAKKEVLSIDTGQIEGEEIFDGFYGVCTSLADSPEDIIKVCHRRWEIEECFRIMKSEFKARPVYLRRDDRIKAHFMTCFMALLIYRLLEKKLEGKFTCCQIIGELRDMNFFKIQGEGYIPTYTRTDLTDALHDAFGFRTDYQIVTTNQMKKIITSSRK
jgi:transposase